MKIVFHISPHPEHVEATFALAGALARRGDDVTYTVIEDLRPIVLARGFRCAVIHRHAVPGGTLAALERLPAGEPREWARVALGDRIAGDYFQGAIEAVLEHLDPALVIAAVPTFSPIQFAAPRLGIPCMQLSMSFSRRLDARPPLTSELAPDAPSLVSAA